MANEVTGNGSTETGISIMEEVQWGTHFCCFYETKQDLIETLVPYFKTGLEDNEFCLWVVSQALSVEEAKHALEQAVPDLERHLAEGTLEILTHDEWYLRDGRWDSQRVLQSWREKLNQASAKRSAGFRGAGDGGWIQDDDWRVFSEYEKQVNDLIADQRSIILCTYPLTTSGGDQVFDVAHIHQAAVARRDGQWEVIETPELKKAKAEIQRLNDELKKKVEERTEELATANEALRAEIAERKLAEEEVKRAENRIRRVIDTTPALIHTGRPDGYLDYFNQRWLKYVGLSLEEIDGWAWTNVIHPDDVEGMVNGWRAAIASGEPFQYEARVRRAEGEYRWMLHHKVPLRDEQGDIVKWYGSSIDIEDLKRAERQSQLLIDAIPQQIWSGPPDGTLDYCNDRWRSYMGLGLEELQGDGWQAMLHPDDRDRVLKAWHESVANGTPYEQEERHRAADGTYRWFLARGLPLRDAEGRIVRWYGTNTDIEDRKRAENELRKSQQQYESLVHSIDGIVWEVDAETFRFTFVSKQAERILGYPLAQWFEPNFWRDHLHRDDREWAVGFCVNAIEQKMDHQFEYRMIAADGRGVWLRDIVTVNVVGDGSMRLRGVMVDITERRRAEEALRESESLWRTVFDNAAIGIGLVNSEGWPIETNPALQRMLGYTREELSHLWFVDFTHPDDVSREMALHQEVIEAKRDHYQLEKRFIRKDGQVRWVNLTASVIPAEHTREAFGVGMVEDITERKLAEEALGISEQNFRKAFYTSPAPAVIVRIRDRQWLNVNSAFERTFGHTAAEVVGKTGAELGVWPDLHEREEMWRRFEQDKNSINNYETRLVTKSGALLDVLLSTQAIELSGEECFLASIIDITERKRAEEALRQSEDRLRLIIDAIPDQIWSGPPDGTNDYVNARWRAETGLGPEDMRGHGWQALLHPDDRDRVLKAWTYSVQTGTPYEQEERHRTADGTYRWYLNRGLPLRDAEGRIVRWYGTNTDIEDRKRAEKEAEDANHQLRSLSHRLLEVQEEERRNLARELHDEIGQALTAAKINTDMLRSAAPTDICARLDENAAILERLLQQTRQISLDLRPPVLDDLGLVAALRWYVDQQAKRAGLLAKFAADARADEASAPIQIACFRLAQEAITNAIRHAGATTLTLELRCRDSFLNLLVQDDGVGFDVAKAEARAEQGGSLGLIGMKERAALAGGRVRIVSTPGEGTTLDIRLPLRAAEAASRREISASE